MLKISVYVLYLHLVNYLKKMGYRSNSIIDELVKATKALGDIAKMQISPEILQMVGHRCSACPGFNCSIKS